MRHSILLLVAGLALMVPRVVLADDAPRVDVVEMNDGTRLTGSLVELKRGTYVIIEVQGKPTKVPWSKVKNVLRDQPPAAPPAPPPPAPPPVVIAAAPAGPDTVVFRTGDSITGTVVQQRPGEWVVIRTVDGQTHTLNWDVIKDVRVTSAPVPAGSGQTPAPVPGAPAPAASGTQETTVDTDKGIPSAVHYRSEVDCSKDPENDKCKETTKVDLSKGGLTAGFTHEEVTRVKEPKNYSINFSLDGTFEFGTTTKGGSGGFVSESGGIDIAVSFMVGTKLPGPEGGHFHGIAIQPTGNVTGGSGQSTGGGGGSSPTIGVLTYSGGANVGYQWLYFGSMDPVSLKQHGFGIFLGYHAGAQGTDTWVYTPSQCFEGYCSQPMTTHNSNVDFSQGPVLSLSFPGYNAGTTHLSQGYLTFMALPTGDFFFATVSGGYSF